MRNLKIVRRTIPTLPPTPLPLAASTWDSAEDRLLCAFGPAPDSAIIEVVRLSPSDGPTKTIASWDAPCPNPDLDCDKILNLQHFADSSTICLVLAGGDLVLVREQPLPGEEAIEIVGSVDAGISAAQWSPDEELLALTTNAGTLIYMTREFDAVTNITLTPDDIKASNHVSVGWGKRETQFQGKRAKALRDPTVPEVVDEGKLSNSDDRSTSIAWRGDGAYVAINTVEAEERRMIRVYSRDGELDSVSEPVDGLESALSWRPAGNIIVGIRRQSDRVDAVFFERNGLRHGDFNLRLTPEQQSSWGSNIILSWNADSTVLAVAYKDRVQFWTMGNYHYYLKQEVKTTQESLSAHALAVRWHPERSLRCSIVDGANVQDIEMVSSVNSGSHSAPHDLGATAVIDGSTLKLTPLRLANVPPPVSLHEVTVETRIRDVSMASSTNRFVIACDDEVLIYEYLTTRKPPSQPKLVHRLPMPFTNLSPRQVLLDQDGNVVLLVTDSHTGFTSCWTATCSTDVAFETLDIDVIDAAQILFDSTQRLLGVLALDGTLKFFDRKENLAPTNELFKFPANVTSIDVARYDDMDIYFTLTGSGSLYANDRLLVRNCTSALVTPAHLVFTTTNHLLKFVHLASVEAMSLPSDEPESDERCRRIERGAKLVTAMPTAYSVVLQMPRGNLETIYPRAMVLDGIRKSIDVGNYRKAFLACRNQRVDMNILYDHAPEMFIASTASFIDQLRDPAHLDLFVSQLRNEDVTVSMYRNTSKDLTSGRAGLNGVTAVELPSMSIPEESHTENLKVNRVCDAILKELEKSSEAKTQNIITAHVCKSPPDLDAGLTVVGNLPDPDFAERAAEHICFLADVNQLYDNALGLYNLELALLIAQQSQKDPREYLPYMQSLQELEPVRRQFEIDNKLSRRTKALLHLDHLQAHEEFNEYLQKHELYLFALDLVKYQPERLREVMVLYANYLNSKDRFADAGIAYDYLNDYTSAAAAYRAAHLWREALTSAQLVPYTPEQLTDLASTLAENLVELKDFSAAAVITLEYLNDVPSAAKLYCRGYYFAEAMRILVLHKQSQLIPEVIDTAIVESSATMTELLADFKTQVAAQIPRLRELRQKKAEDPLAFYGGDPAAALGVDFPDNVSLAPTDATTSAGTFMTRYTGRTGTINTQTTHKTSKNRRKEERKRARGKKGSVYEEEYLVASIGRLIDRFNSTQDEIQRLLAGLVRRAMRERTKAIQDLVEEVALACKACIGEVFQVDSGPKPAATQPPDEGDPDERPQGADGVLWDSMQQAATRREPPVVKVFEKMSLVG